MEENKKTRKPRVTIPKLSGEENVLIARKIFRQLAALSTNQRKEVLLIVAEYESRAAEDERTNNNNEAVAFSSAGDEV